MGEGKGEKAKGRRQRGEGKGEKAKEGRVRGRAHLHVRRQVHQCLLPHRAALDIVDVVDLVGDHRAEVEQIGVAHLGLRRRLKRGGGRRRARLGLSSREGLCGVVGGGLLRVGVRGACGVLDELIAQDL